MSRHTTFVERALRGDVINVDDEVEDAIEAWHESASGMDLHDWLGLTWEEYSIFCTKPKMLRPILASRQWNAPSFLELARTNDFRLAARGANPDEIAEAHEWLLRTGRI